MKKFLSLLMLLLCTKVLCQTSQIQFNCYLAIYSEHLHSHYQNSDMDRELALADLNLDFLKEYSVTITKRDCIYKFGKYDSMGEPSTLCNALYNSSDQSYTIDYCHNSNQIGYIQFTIAKPSWVYCYHDSKSIWIIPKNGSEEIQKFRTDGKIIATYPYSFSGNNITRIGEYAFEYDSNLLSSYIDKIDNNPTGKHFSKTEYCRNRIIWDHLIPKKLIHSSGYFSNGENDTERDEMNITVESSNSDGVWTDLSLWVEDSTCEGGKRIVYKLHREIVRN